MHCLDMVVSLYKYVSVCVWGGGGVTSSWTSVMFSTEVILVLFWGKIHHGVSAQMIYCISFFILLPSCESLI